MGIDISYSNLRVEILSVAKKYKNKFIYSN